MTAWSEQPWSEQPWSERRWSERRWRLGKYCVTSITFTENFPLRSTLGHMWGPHEGSCRHMCPLGAIRVPPELYVPLVPFLGATRATRGHMLATQEHTLGP